MQNKTDKGTIFCFFQPTKIISDWKFLSLKKYILSTEFSFKTTHPFFLNSHFYFLWSVNIPFYWARLSYFFKIRHLMI